MGPKPCACYWPLTWQNPCICADFLQLARAGPLHDWVLQHWAPAAIMQQRPANICSQIKLILQSQYCSLAQCSGGDIYIHLMSRLLLDIAYLSIPERNIIKP